MSNIVKFPDRRRAVEEREKLLQKREEQRNREARQNETSGHAARRVFGSFRHRIARAERIVLAQNMAGLFSEFAIQSSALPWQKDYSSIESFHNDVHRIRLMGEASKNRRIMAHAAPWLRLLRYIHQSCRTRATDITLISGRPLDTPYRISSKEKSGFAFRKALLPALLMSGRSQQRTESIAIVHADRSSACGVLQTQPA
jgi:hypothetical protein